MEGVTGKQHNPLMQTFGRNQLDLKLLHNSPKEPVDAQDRASVEKGQLHLRNIDEINDKINGLIQSISQSCR